MMSQIMIVDDDQSLCRALGMVLGKKYRVLAAADGRQALRITEKKQPDAILLDIGLPGMSGIEVLKALRQKWPEIAVIMITAVDEVKTIVEAIREGASDYLVKPIDSQELLITVANALERRRLRLRIHDLEESGKEGFRFNPLGECRSIKHVMERARLASTSEDTPVLIIGETGSGKSMLARMIHYNRLEPGPFIAVNCGALNGNLIESELFGYEPGTFTGALNTGKKGRFEMAREGTLFLDEIGAMPIVDQAKLLGVLEDRQFYRVGGTSPIDMKSRLIAASNIDFIQAVAQGHFRRDLYYRLNVIQIEIPPLRERKNDIPLIARHFLSEYSKKFGKRFRDIAPDALERMIQYPWPGNIRELRNLMERITLLENDDAVRLKHLDLPIVEGAPKLVHNIESDSLDYENLTAELIRKAMQQAGNNVSRAARILNIPIYKLRYRLKKLGLR